MPGPGRKFEKGKSPNPGGKTKKRRDIEAIAQRICEGPTEDNHLALSELAAMAIDVENEPKDRRACWELLLAYGYGKPTQRTELSGPDGGPLDLRHAVEAMTPEQKIEAGKIAIARLEEARREETRTIEANTGGDE